MGSARGLLAVVASAVLAACTVAPTAPGSSDPLEPSAPPTVASAPPASAADAVSRLATLKVTDRFRGDSGYRRDAFGSRWRDVDGNGCNQRDDVLLRDAVRGSTTLGRQGACDHDVLAGGWLDPYSGRRLVLDDLKDQRQSQAVQIDHVVPLAEAWISGASGWSANRRERFANDLGVLLAVDGPTNASKGSSDPAAWKPRKAYQCEYARRWITVKTTWKMTIDPSEKDALEQMLGYC